MSTRSLVRPEGCAALHYSHASYSLKGEDVAFVYDGLQSLCPEPHAMARWDLFGICDGHGGQEAAEFVKANLPSVLAPYLPKGQPPEPESQEGRLWLRTVRNAINAAFVQLDLDFRKEQIPPTVGCTVTIALFCGWILTIANIGDSEAFLDFGSGFPLEVTTSHKIDTNLDEQVRLARCGKEVRPLSEELFRPARSNEDGIGPLRVWPCGLAVSRAIGDYDCGAEVLASPNVIQIKIPFAGARLTIASDGLWDHLTAKRVVKRSRKHVVRDVPKQLIAKARKVSGFGLTDDTTVLVLDILPTARTDFKDISKKLRGPRNVLTKWGKKIGRGKAKGFPPVVLVKEDMAPAEPAPYNSKKSVMSTTSSKTIRPPKESKLQRTKTFGGMSKRSTDSESQEELDEKDDKVEFSFDLDTQGLRAANASLHKFHSERLNL